MKCPYCGAFYHEDQRFCGYCGGALLYKEKKGTHLVPILILLALSVLGICIYFAFPLSVPEPPPAEVIDEGSWFTAEDGNLRFDSEAYTGSGQLEIPKRVDGEWVEWIDDSCFADCDMLTEILLPGTVRHIGTAAFADCDSLRGIQLPDGLITLGRECFRSCDRLEAVHIPDSVNFIGADTFAGCDSLRYIFYDGTQQKWRQVCGQDLGPNVTIICTDGSYS